MVTQNRTRRSQVMDVTPQLAAQWLAMNTNNRPVRKEAVKRYAEDMAAGRWVLTHQGIAFGEDGTLYDGQHRLSAVVMSGATVKLEVTWGMTPEQRLYLDQSIPRASGDTFTIVYGIDHGKDRVAIARMLLAIRRGFMGAKSNGVMWEVLKFYEPELTWAVGACIGNELRYAPISGALAFAYRRHPDKVQLFSELARSGAGMDAGHPVLTWRNAIMTAKRSGMNGSQPRFETAAKTLQAIYAFAKGHDLTKLVMPKTDKVREYFGAVYPREPWLPSEEK